MAKRGSLRSLRSDVREAQQAVIYEAIREFDFSDYSLDDVDQVKGGNWHGDLALKISQALLPDVP